MLCFFLCHYCFYIYFFHEIIFSVLINVFWHFATVLVLLVVCVFCHFYFAFVNARGSFTHIFLLFLFGWVVCLFNLFFFAHFVNSKFALFCCAEFSQLKFTVPRGSWFFLSAFFLAFVFVVIYLGALLVVQSSFSFFSLFSNISCCFPSFGVLTTFALPYYFARFAFFSCFSLCACIVSGM